MDHLFAILRTLNRHRYELFLIPVLTMALIYHFTANTPSKYKTEAKLYLNLQEGKGMSLSDEDLKQYQIQSYFTNTIELLKSKKTIEKVKVKTIESALRDSGFFALGNRDLITYKADVEARLAQINESTEGLVATSFPDSIMIRYLNFHQLSTGRLGEMIMSFRIMDSNFIKFELSETIPEKTYLLATLFIDALTEENRDLAKNKIKGHKDIIENLVRQAKADLEIKIKKLEDFKVEKSIINLGEHTKAIVVYIVQLEGQRANLLATVGASRTGKAEVLNTVHQGNDIILDVSGNADVLHLKEQLRKLNKEMLISAFEKGSVASDDAIQKNIAATKDQIQQKIVELTRKVSYDPTTVKMDLVSKYLDYDLRAETSADMIGIIDAEIDRVNKYSKRFAPYESIIGSYEQEISTAQNAYLVLLNKLNLTQTMEYGSGENIVEVIDPPYLPQKPEASKRPMLVAGGGVAVFVLMTAVFIIMQLLDASITTVEKFERFSRLPVIAGLPNEIPAKDKNHLLPSVRLIHNQQFFKLLQSITTQCMGSPGILLLTSSQKEEGKHYVAGQLQGLMNKAGYKVAFVDADWMSTQEYPGFINYKERVSNQGLLINRKEIMHDLAQMKSESDLVVVITSPLNLSAEAEFWTEISKHVLYIFKANRLINKVDKRVEEMFIKTKLQFLGTVINKLNIENMEDYLGEIPRKRNVVRVLFKKLLKRNF